MSPLTSPHSEHQWPHGICGDSDIERLTAVLTAASAVAQLLIADNNIATNFRDADDPSAEPAPFSDNVRFGLLLALNLCVMETEDCAEKLANRAAQQRGQT